MSGCNGSVKMSASKRLQAKEKRQHFLTRISMRECGGRPSSSVERAQLPGCSGRCGGDQRIALFIPMQLAPRFSLASVVIARERCCGDAQHRMSPSM
jgi:hypothetical protein